MTTYTSQLLLITIIFCSSLLAYAQNTPSVSITNWQGNKKAAVCVTLDDGCDGQLATARPIMDSLLIKGTFYIITDLDYNCDGGPNASPPFSIYDNTGSPTYWKTLQAAIDTGHEIGAHTVHHPELGTITWPDYGIDSVAKEIKISKATLEQELHAPGQNNVPYNVLTFAYPYGDGQDDTTIVDTVQKYFVAARGAGTKTSLITWDTYNDAAQGNTGFINYYYQVESYACTDTLSAQWFTQQLDNTIQYSGWYNAMYHNIGGNSIQGNEYSVSVDNFRTQMEILAGKGNDMWIAPFKDVARYSKENINATAIVKSCNNKTTVIGLTTTITDTNFSVPLTLVVSNFVCACNSIDSVMQAGKKLAFTLPAVTQIQFNAIPNAGDITIYTDTGTVSPVTGIVTFLATDYFELDQNVPNPAFPATSISYNLKQAGNVQLEFFNISGTMVKTLVNEEQLVGRYTYSLNTEILQAGVYFYRLTSGNAFDVKKMVVIR